MIAGECIIRRIDMLITSIIYEIISVAKYNYIYISIVNIFYNLPLRRNGASKT